MRAIIVGILCGLLLPFSVFAYTSPGKPTGYVNDFAHVLNAPEIQSLDAKLKTLEQTTGAQGAVVTIPTLSDETIETYAVKLFEEWGIGNKKDDNGFLILVAPNDRQVRIEVGYGLEGMLTDLQSGNIIRMVMTPQFKEGNYAGGITGAVDAISSIITNSPDAAQFSRPAPTPQGGLKDFNIFGWFFGFIVVMNVLSNLLSRTKSWWLGGVIGAILGGVIGIIWGFFYAGIISGIILTIAGLIFDYVVSKKPPGSGGGGFWPIFFGGGRGGGGFGGGGFGGFGGGSSGGGGASGRW